ncbi:MAG: preprotein translocase subunit SecE [Thermomicrobiales bacterium]
MSSQRQQAANTPTAVKPSRSELARPPKPTVQPDTPETQKNAYVSKFDQIKKQWQDTVAELKKVTWPDRETTKNLTIVVIAISAVLGAFLGGLDWILQQIFAAL